MTRPRKDVDDFDSPSRSAHSDIEVCETLKKQDQYRVYYESINALYQHYTPTLITCREKEGQVISQFLESGIMSKGCTETLYISGVPGIGKTMCVRDSMQKVSRTLRQKIPRVKDFELIYVNAMNLQKPDKIYSVILHQIVPLLRNISQARSLMILNDILTKGEFTAENHKGYFKEEELREIKRRIAIVKVVFIDQIDYLATRNQQVMYNLFEWTHNKNSKIVMVTTSNTIDFPERLQEKILSRIGNTRLVFRPYTSSQIQQILQNRMQGLKVFQKEAIRLISMKIAKVSSDIRKCLFVLRSAITMHVFNLKSGKTTSETIPIETVNLAHKSLYKNPLLNSLPLLPENHKVVLTKVCQLIKQNGKYCWISELFVKLKSLNDNQFFRPTMVQQILIALKELHILKISMESRHRDRRVICFPQIPIHVREIYIEPGVQIDAIMNSLIDN